MNCFVLVFLFIRLFHVALIKFTCILVQISQNNTAKGQTIWPGNQKKREFTTFLYGLLGNEYTSWPRKKLFVLVANKINKTTT